MTARVKGFDEIEAELRAFEAAERKRLNLEDEPVAHWFDSNPGTFTRAERARTTILCGGLTMAHDRTVSAALSGLGYHVKPLDVPDTESLRFGKEFGNRGQCNPTYFTVGNLVKYLVRLRDVEKRPVEDIIASHVFMTAGACGPCRFGTYVTEYRKALRDAGFEGFRVLLFQQQGGLRQATGDDAGLEFTPRFFLAVLRAIMAADVLNLMAYRARPYEVDAGETDRALAKCLAILETAFSRRRSTVVALLTCRRVMNRIRVDWLQPKPKVAIIGEFWAMTTEGDGNYRLQRFLEAEGAEVDVQPVTAWLLYNIWEHAWDTKRRMTLKHDDLDRQFGLHGKNPRRKLALLTLADRALRGAFAMYCRAIGLGRCRLANMDEIAIISHTYYDNHLRGGEGHMEVGKLIQHVEQRKSHMVISVKPFGCMPSSGVSDGVQSLVTARHPGAIFCPVETTGDSAVNVQSRVLMDLFKARQRAQQEHGDLLRAAGWSPETVERHARRRRFDRPVTYPGHIVAGTATNAVLALLPKAKRWRALERSRLPERSGHRIDPVHPPAIRPGVGRPAATFRNGPITLVPWPR
jgi:predicted nucleotide-binding protein (sugar kinase/HSP70/actin superfamily)